MYNNKVYDPIYYCLKYVVKYYYIVFILLLDSIFGSLFIFIPSFVMKNIIHYVSLDESFYYVFTKIKPYFLFYFLFYWSAIIIFRISDYIVKVKIFPQIKKDIVLENFSYIMDQSKEYFQKNFSGEISEKIDNLKDNVFELINWFFNKFLTHFLSIVIAAIGLLYYNFECGCIILVWILSFFLVSIFFAKKISYVASDWANANSIINGVLVDVISNFLVVKLFNNKKYEEANISRYAKDIQDRESQMAWFFFIGWMIYSVSFFIVQVFSLYLLLNQYKNNLINASDFAFVWSMNVAVVNRLWAFLKDFVEFPEYYGFIKESLILLKQDMAIKNSPTAKNLIFKKGRIEFKNVDFNFGDQVIFNNLNIVIEPKQKVGLVGFSGMGKSTFINLLLRLYNINKGSITIDEQNIKYVKLQSLYENINVIPQEGSLFYRSIFENIAYGNKHYTNREIKKAIKLAHLDQLIDSLPEKEDTMVGERGSLISGGQKQRIAIARSCLKKSGILILDEATSNLDTITEDILQKNLEYMMKDRTVLIIAHKLSTIEKMDRVLVFDENKIVEDGTHLELLKKDGLYKKLSNI